MQLVRVHSYTTLINVEFQNIQILKKNRHHNDFVIWQQSLLKENCVAHILWSTFSILLWGLTLKDQEAPCENVLLIKMSYICD